MRHHLAAAALALGLVLAPALLTAQEIGPIERSVAISAEEWLALLDAHDYEESWSHLAHDFPNGGSVQQWEASSRQTRGQLGELASREVQQVTRASTIPRGPEGEYIIVEFRSSFKPATEVVETVIMVDEGEHGWQVARYSVHRH